MDLSVFFSLQESQSRTLHDGWESVASQTTSFSSFFWCTLRLGVDNTPRCIGSLLQKRSTARLIKSMLRMAMLAARVSKRIYTYTAMPVFYGGADSHLSPPAFFFLGWEPATSEYLLERRRRVLPRGPA